MGYFLISLEATLALGLAEGGRRDTVKRELPVACGGCSWLGMSDVLLGTMISDIAFEIISCPSYNSTVCSH